MILIVDDKQENVFSLRTVLEQHGFSTDAALSGEDALKKLLKKEYALIILDVQMPGMDGFEVAEAISGFNKTKDIPIIFLSAVNTDKMFITRGFQSGALEYLTKPVDPDILILKVRNFYRLYEKTHALKQAEHALKATVNELHQTLEALPYMAFSTDPHGRLQFVNKKWLDFAEGADKFPQTAYGTPSLELLWLTSIRQGTSVEHEVLIQRIADGELRHHLLKATPIYCDGTITKWVGSISSIHEQKLQNETLERKVAERTHELVEINRELSVSNSDLQQFSSVASHDLKEPLRKIMVFGNMIKERGNLQGTLSDYLDKVLVSSERMMAVINDMLSFASLSAPDLFKQANLNHIIDGILSDLELNITEKQAVIQVAPLPEIEVIPGLIRQLFHNLISNALKFSRPGLAPSINITPCSMVQHHPHPAGSRGNYLCVQVSDNGIGFEEKYAQQIFHIFQRLNNKKEYEGTGIGLAIAKKIVDRHNGFITASSHPGEGAVFTICLPIKQDILRKNKEEEQVLATSL